MKKTISMLLIFVMITFAAASFTVSATETLTGAAVDEYGVITWDDFEGAKDYWLGVDGGFTPVIKNDNLHDRIDGPGDYLIELEAYTANGETRLASAVFYVRFDGKKYHMIDGPTTTAPTDKTTTETLVPLNVTISNVQLTEDGILTWTAGPDSADFWLGIDFGYLPAENGGSIADRITEPGEYFLELQAFDPRNAQKLYTFPLHVNYDGSRFFVPGPPTESIGTTTAPVTVKSTVTEKVTEESHAQTATDTTEMNKTSNAKADQPAPSSGPSTIVIVLCIAAGLCVVGVILLVIVRKTKK